MVKVAIMSQLGSLQVSGGVQQTARSVCLFSLSSQTVFHISSNTVIDYFREAPQDSGMPSPETEKRKTRVGKRKNTK